MVISLANVSICSSKSLQNHRATKKAWNASSYSKVLLHIIVSIKYTLAVPIRNNLLSSFSDITRIKTIRNIYRIAWNSLACVYIITVRLVDYFSLLWSTQIAFLQPSSYKDELGKNIVYVVDMNFLETYGRICSFEKKIPSAIYGSHRLKKIHDNHHYEMRYLKSKSSPIYVSSIPQK